MTSPDAETDQGVGAAWLADAASVAAAGLVGAAEGAGASTGAAGVEAAALESAVVPAAGAWDGSVGAAVGAAVAAGAESAAVGAAAGAAVVVVAVSVVAPPAGAATGVVSVGAAPAGSSAAAVNGTAESTAGSPTTTVPDALGVSVGLGVGGVGVVGVGAGVDVGDGAGVGTPRTVGLGLGEGVVPMVPGLTVPGPQVRLVLLVLVEDDEVDDPEAPGVAPVLVCTQFEPNDDDGEDVDGRGEGAGWATWTVIRRVTTCVALRDDDVGGTGTWTVTVTGVCDGAAGSFTDVVDARNGSVDAGATTVVLAGERAARVAA
jgi:hypothetical protein